MTFRDRRPDVRQERDAVPLEGILLIGAAVLLVGGGLSLWAVGVVHEREETLRPSGDFPEQRWVMPEDVYGVHQGLFDEVSNAELYDRTPKKDLASFGWVNKDQRLVKIPIEIAMKLRASRGAP
jgi:hypothetical protein